MEVFTDSIDYAEQVLPGPVTWEMVKASDIPSPAPLFERLYETRPLHRTVVSGWDYWQYLLIAERPDQSQYDLVVGLSQENIELPDGLLCLSGSSRNLHGQRNRPWAGLPGNIHLTAFMAPDRIIEHFGAGFVVLAAVTVVDTIDDLDSLQGRASIKWVNDILIDGAKVAGVLAHSLSVEGRVTGAVLGIGLNVEQTPAVLPDRFVPKAASLRDFAENPAGCDCRLVLKPLSIHLARNYRLLCEGRFADLLYTYRHRSACLGKEIEIISDSLHGPEEIIASGALTGIGDNLELYLNGRREPVTRGRLVLKT